MLDSRFHGNDNALECHPRGGGDPAFSAVVAQGYLYSRSLVPPAGGQAKARDDNAGKDKGDF